MRTYEIHEKVKLGNQKCSCYVYLCEVQASTTKEAKSKTALETGIPENKLLAKLK